ncbi:hypothetical protein IWW54_005580 [Coemansia sp. RSA 2705]|nr:hypothetical protein IWW54_005580 [Coemansia sp. RSA 2705]
MNSLGHPFLSEDAAETLNVPESTLVGLKRQLEGHFGIAILYITANGSIRNQQLKAGYAAFKTSPYPWDGYRIKMLCCPAVRGQRLWEFTVQPSKVK